MKNPAYKKFNQALDNAKVAVNNMTIALDNASSIIAELIEIQETPLKDR